MRISGASGRTGCVIASGLDRQPHPKCPRPLLGIDVAGCARCALDEEIELRSPASERCTRSQCERSFVHPLVPGKEWQCAASGTAAQRELKASNTRASDVSPKTEVPGIIRRRALRSEPAHL